MACFLVDYENQLGTALEGISHIRFKKSDEIILFYSKKAESITMELHRELEQINAKKQYIKVESGAPNSLDFQLVSYLGSRINQNPEIKYYIISKDKAFKYVCHFWINQSVFVRRIDGFYCYKEA